MKRPPVCLAFSSGGPASGGREGPCTAPPEACSGLCGSGDFEGPSAPHKLSMRADFGTGLHVGSDSTACVDGGVGGKNEGPVERVAVPRASRSVDSAVRSAPLGGCWPTQLVPTSPAESGRLRQLVRTPRSASRDSGQGRAEAAPGAVSAGDPWCEPRVLCLCRGSF